jgi:hypothetical protein
MIVNFSAGIFGGFLDGIAVQNIPPKYKDQDFRIFIDNTAVVA